MMNLIIFLKDHNIYLGILKMMLFLKHDNYLLNILSEMEQQQSGIKITLALKNLLLFKRL